MVHLPKIILPDKEIPRVFALSFLLRNMCPDFGSRKLQSDSILYDSLSEFLKSLPRPPLWPHFFLLNAPDEGNPPLPLVIITINRKTVMSISDCSWGYHISSMTHIDTIWHITDHSHYIFTMICHIINHKFLAVIKLPLPLLNIIKHLRSVAYPVPI